MSETEFKKPSLEKLKEAQATLKKIHEKEPSDEVLEIINQIQDEELDIDTTSIDDLVARPTSNSHSDSTQLQ